MLRDNSQLKLSLSPYQGIYEVIIPANHLLRRIKENIDFSFVNPMLRKQYCEHFGRPAKEPEMMFKLLFLKKLYDLSDEILISSAQTDMAYKYFLDLEPEAKMIDPSLLTKFRKTRITEDILEEILKETIQQALEVTNKAVMEALDGLPPVKVHCSLLAEEAIHAALWDYAEKHGIKIEGLQKPKSDIHEGEEAEEEEY